MELRAWYYKRDLADKVYESEAITMAKKYHAEKGLFGDRTII